MNGSKKALIGFAVLVIVAGGVLYYSRATNPQEDLQAIKDQTHQTIGNVTGTPPEQVSYDQETLLRNCAKDIPLEKADNVSFDSDKKIVTVYWTDENSNNISLVLPYMPEKQFAGCSASAKEILGRVEQSQH